MPRLRKHTPGCPCCDPGEFCNTYYSAPAVPEELWVDIPLLIGGCSEACAAEIEGTYRLDLVFVAGFPETNCFWEIVGLDWPSCCGGSSSEIFAFINAAGLLRAAINACFAGDDPVWETVWDADITPSISIINHDLEDAETSGTDPCIITGTTVHIQEALNRVFCITATLIITGHQATIE